MQVLNAVSIDDEIENIKVLKHLVEKYCPHIQIVGQAHDVSSGTQLIDSLKPDIIYLDIQLGHELSFDILDQISHKNAKVVFVTSYNDYAIKAFQYNAIDYLLKPLDIEEIIRVGHKIRDDFEKRDVNLFQHLNDLKSYVRDMQAQEFITIPSIKKIDIVKTSSILYIKSETKFSIFVLDKGEIISSKNLGAYETLLPKFKFFRVHNSYIVNIDKIRYVHKEDDHYCLMENRKKIPISRRRYQTFIKLMDPTNAS